MATAAALSLDVTTTGVTVKIPDHDLARLMYYLCCVTEDVGLSILDDDLIDYKNYRRLSRPRRALVFESALLLSPGELINKLIFRDDEGAITGTSRNEFCEISVACGVVSLQRDIIIAGQAQSITKVMFFKQSWLNDYYIRPLARAQSEMQHRNIFSRPFVLYFAPILHLAALFLSTFAYLSPAVMLHDRVALLTVTPFASNGVNGTSLFLGALGPPSLFESTCFVVDMYCYCQGHAQRKTSQPQCNARVPPSILSMVSSLSFPSFFLHQNFPHFTNRFIRPIICAQALHFFPSP
jgi:hypothetical protein